MLAAGAAPVPGQIADVRTDIAAFVNDIQPGGVRPRSVNDALLPAEGPYPGHVTAFLERLDADGLVIGAGEAISAADDPRDQLGAQGPPEEIFLEVGTVSLQEVAYEAGADAIEQRVIRFGPSGQLLAGQDVRTSSVFLRAALVIGSDAETADLTGANVRLGVQIDIATAEDTFPVFSGAVDVQGGPAGTITVEALNNIPAEAVEIVDLSDRLASTGDPGILWVVTLPNVEIPYAYEVPPGGEAVLAATFRLKAVNLPDGVLAAGVAGGPFQRLGGLIDLLDGGPTAITGEDIQAMINEVIASFPPGPQLIVPEQALQSRETPTGMTSPVPCGLSGVELGVLLAVPAGLVGRRRLNRRRKRRAAHTGGT